MVEEMHAAHRDISLSNLSHEELLRMLAGLQADVEARDIVIATLQHENNSFLVDNAKHHRYFVDKTFDIDLDDPILALQRDSHISRVSDHCLDSKGISLDELLDHYRRTHDFFHEQLQAADQRYAALCASFENERKRLERDAAQGDDVVAMLEKEREKLQSELENERNQNKCLQMELKKTLDSYAHQKALSQRQRVVAAQLIKEKYRLQKELIAKCAQIDRLESKLGLTSPLSSDRPSSISIPRNSSPTVKTPIGSSAHWSPAGSAAFGGSGNGSLSRKKSTSPPSGCRESANGPPPPPSPLVSTATVKVDAAGSPGLSISNRVNGCSPPSSATSFSETSSSCDLPKAKSPPPVKTRPEPPVRRTPEFNTPPPFTTSHKFNPLEVEISRISDLEKAPSIGAEDDEKHAETPSPPPPPPQMQLHYPYPGMQGNTHHPPIRGSTWSIDFGGGSGHYATSTNSTISSSAHFSPDARPTLSTSTTTPGTTHQFPYAQPQRIIPSGAANRLNTGMRKPTPMLLSQQQERTIPITSKTTVSHGGMSRSGAGLSPRVAVAGRTATAGSGNLYINGK